MEVRAGVRRQGQEITEGTEEMKSYWLRTRAEPEKEAERASMRLHTPPQDGPTFSSSSLIATQDPTNGYYNVRAHEDRPSSRAVLYADYRAPGPARFDGRPSSRLSHSSGYAQLNTYSRAPAPDYGPEPTPPGPAAPAGNDTASQLSYENYEKFNSHPFPGAAGYPTYRLGYPQAPPSGLERTPYEAYDPIGKYATATRFSYTSQHSDYGQRFQQRMQTHV